MKKIILTAVAVFAFSFANAQDSKSFGFAKGDIYATGTVSSSSTSVSGSSTATNFAPSVGYFVTDAIALEAGFSTASSGNVKSSDFQVGAAYVFNAKNQFSTNVSLGLAFGSGTDGGDYKSMGLQLAYGLNYFVSNHFAVRANIAGLSYVSVTPNGGSAVSNTTIGLDMSSLSLGLVYKF
ncbi:MAG: porin family protein [Flavobacteriaceae bacterium]|jgi:hypothetical protein|nr:porin family protein [Flavobacteriaceae bacterium]